MNRHFCSRTLSLILLFGFCSFILTTTVGTPLNAADQKGKWHEYFESGKQSKSEDDSNPEGMVDLIDVPTTNVVDYGAFRLNERFYSQGGVQSHLSFGVFRRLNIGATWDVEKLIGSDSAYANVPTLNAKFRVYDGDDVLPSFAIGYDGQGRFYNHDLSQYNEREHGLYGLLGREIFVPELEAYGGANIAKFKEGEAYGFIGASYTIEQKLAIMVEYDNIRTAPESRFNAGIRIFPLPSLGLDFDVRNIASDPGRERIIRINYVGSF